MKIVAIKGGLGNQMFQYAFAIALKQLHPDESVLIDIQLYKHPFVKTYKGNNFYHNGFEIEKVFPNAKLPVAKWQDIIKVSYYIPNYIFSRAARRILPTRKTEFIQPDSDSYLYDSRIMSDISISYFEGYWLSPLFFNFFRDKIWEVFLFKPFDTDVNINLAKKLKESNSVTIHIRRGDYLNNPMFQGICSLDYYLNAINEAKSFIQDPQFFIFSNDQAWCEENLKDVFAGSSVYFVNNNKGQNSYRDMQLMTLARCNILANSSFSWWGAYLNQREDHIVFAPKKWVNIIPCDDAYDEQWIKL